MSMAMGGPGVWWGGRGGREGGGREGGGREGGVKLV